MRLKTLGLFTFLSLFLLCLNSCKKDKEVTKQQEVTFSFSEKVINSNSFKSLKNKSDAKAVIVTIKSSSGTVTYDKKKLDLINFNGSFISQSLLLNVSDNYQLTEFLVVDVNNSVIYAAPLQGSTNARFVSAPLPISFSVSKDKVTNVVPEVISTDCICQASDFGYVSFDFKIVDLVCFKMNIQTIDTATRVWTFIAANITIKGDTNQIYKNTFPAKTDSIKLQSKYTTYKISISKDGYLTKDTVLTNEQIKGYINQPLKIILTLNPTPIAGTVTDIDGNVYHTVKIGTQVWMKENLKVTHYRNGDAITNITGGFTSSKTTSGAYSWYNDDQNNQAIYGALYNGYAVRESRKICPVGYHVPSDSEWTTLTDFLGGESIAGGKMKEIGTTHWNSPNTGADNSSGFSALPAGQNFSSWGAFFYINTSGEWWSTDDYYRTVDYNTNSVTRYSHSGVWGGLSVRCLKDAE